LDYLSLPTPHNEHIFLVSNFFNLAILVGKKMGKIVQIQGKMSTTKIIIKKFREKTFK